MSEHYFSESPSTEYKKRSITVTLGGKEVTVVTAPGVFSNEGVDRGTNVLLQHLPHPPAGDILDLGCGWGAISLESALLEPAATIWSLDVNERALALTAENAAALGLQNVRAVSAADIPATQEFAAIFSNPPIRVGKAVLHELMHTWLPRLAAGGNAYLVVSKSLGANSFEKWLQETFAASHTVARVARDKGFHVIKVTKH